MNYLVADLVIRVKNAAAAGRRDVSLPYSKLCLSIAKVLEKERFLKAVAEKEVEGRKVIQAQVAYDRRVPVLTEIQIISKPSLRIYIGSSDLASRARHGYRTLVLSTSKGVMTGKEAQKEGLGGELLFEIQ